MNCSEETPVNFQPLLDAVKTGERRPAVLGQLLLDAIAAAEVACRGAVAQVERSYEAKCAVNDALHRQIEDLETEAEGIDAELKTPDVIADWLKQAALRETLTLSRAKHTNRKNEIHPWEGKRLVWGKRSNVLRQTDHMGLKVVMVSEFEVIK